MIESVLFTSLHTIAAVLWVGGIFLVYKVFRPTAIEQLEPPQRLQMFLGVFDRFFPWVWVFIAALVVSGYWDWYSRLGGIADASLYMHLMHIIGWIMIVLFAWLYFVAYKQFKTAVQNKEFPVAGAILNDKMRPVIVINLALGILEAVIGASGPYWMIL
jgi:uncharacterized membrane protein